MVQFPDDLLAFFACESDAPTGSAFARWVLLPRNAVYLASFLTRFLLISRRAAVVTAADWSRGPCSTAVSVRAVHRRWRGNRSAPYPIGRHQSAARRIFLQRSSWSRSVAIIEVRRSAVITEHVGRTLTRNHATNARRTSTALSRALEIAKSPTSDI